MELSKKVRTALAHRKITKRQLAVDLGISYSYMVRITDKLPPGEVSLQRRRTKELFAVRKGYRMAQAARVIQGEMSLEAAAKLAHCTERTIYRYICKLKST